MSVSSEVQRTLVKSPPELWAELSDPAALARHLGELGEIRILATEPEHTVDWEAAGANGAEVNGRVEIEPSGWGTRVTLSASRALVEPEPAPAPAPEAAPVPEATPVPEAEPEPAPEPAPEIAQPEPKVNAEAEAIEVISEIELGPEPEIAQPEPKPRPVFFARLFRRRRQSPKPEPVVAPAPEPASEPVAVVEIEEPAPTPGAVAAVEIEEPAPEDPSLAPDSAPDQDSPEVDIAAELAELEQRTEAVLTGVLDRLGAAHHRPFSRA